MQNHASSTVEETIISRVEPAEEDREGLFETANDAQSEVTG